MNNKLTLNSYDIANLKDALELYKSNVEIIANTVFRSSDEFIRRNYHLQSVSKLLDFVRMANSENYSQLGGVQTELIIMTNEVKKDV